MSLFLPVFRSLNGSGTRYVTVGGVAVVLHGHARLTADLDLIVDLEPAAAGRAVRCLVDLGLKPRAPVSPLDFAEPETRAAWIADKGMQVFSMFDPGNPLLTVDLFVSHPLPFEELYARSVSCEIQGVEVRIASIADLIALKRLSDRPEDARDIEALERILELRAEEQS